MAKIEKAGIEERWLRDIEVAERLDIGRSTLWQHVRQGDFPAPVRLGDRMTRWRLSGIVEWENSRETQPIAAE